jgi:hypothetical protein
MKTTTIVLLAILLSACNCRYNGIDTREVLVSSGTDASSVDVTEAHTTIVR